MEQLDLSDFFMTKAQASDFSIRLSAVSDRIYETGFNAENVLMEQFGIQKKDKLFSLFRDNNVNIGSGSALKDFIGIIQKKISTLPVVSLQIAFEPNENTLKMLSEWFLVNINKQVLFNIEVRSEIIAGAAITCNGKYADYSIKSEYDKIFTEATNRQSSQQADNHKSTDENQLAGYQSVTHMSMGR